MMNLYKAGEVDALYNHIRSGTRGSIDMRRLKDYMDKPESRDRLLHVQHDEAADERHPRAQGVQHGDRQGRRSPRYQRVDQAADGIFAGGHLSRLSAARRAIRSIRTRARRCWPKPAIAMRAGNTILRSFRSRDVELTYNTTERNRQIAEFVQAQWKQNLGLTVPLQEHGVEDVSRLRAPSSSTRASREPAGSATTWIRTRSSICSSTKTGDNGTGWCDPKYVAMLREANRQTRSGEALRAAGAGREDAARRATGDSALPRARRTG